jgi:hypothetical protein
MEASGVAGFGIVATPSAPLPTDGVAVPVLVCGYGGSVVWLSPGTVSVASSGTVAAGAVPVPGLGSVPEPPGRGRAVPPVGRAGVAGEVALGVDGERPDDPSPGRRPRGTRRCERRRTDRDTVPAAPAAEVDVVADPDPTRPADPAADPSSLARSTRTAASASSAPVKKKRRWRRSTTFSSTIVTRGR